MSVEDVKSKSYSISTGYNAPKSVKKIIDHIHVYQIKRIVNSMSLMIFSYEDGIKITKIQKYEHLKLRRFIRKFGVLNS